jgi:hypothetical protein
MRYLIFTEIEGVKQWVRRFNRLKSGYISITMYSSAPGKAFDFQTQERASEALSKMGIGKAIETQK